MVGHYFVYGGRVTKKQWVELGKIGVPYLYSCRSWDDGNGMTLEHEVLVNHVADIVSDVPLLDETDMNACEEDFDKYIASRKDVTSDDVEWEKKVLEILERRN